MGIIQAIRIFIRLLNAKQWYVLIETDWDYSCDAKINVGQLKKQVDDLITEEINQQELLNQAKELLK
jgi:hypothetical protein